MTTAATAWRSKPPAGIAVDVVIPVLNEARVLEQSVESVHAFLSSRIPYRWRIVIAENGSTDGTVEVARRLCQRLPQVDLVEVAAAGRGRALRAAWTRGDADIVCYTDVDLSTRLEAFLPLFGAIVDEGYDLAIGSRLAAASATTRSFKRQVISKAYNLILRQTLGVGFSDAQTGFKALTREVVNKVLPLVKDESWFLDTELLVLAERLGYRIADIPIVWVEDDDSRVKIVSTAWADLRGIWRVHRYLRQQDGQERALAAPERSFQSEGITH